MSQIIRAVQGVVRFAGGHPAGGVKVVAVDKDLRSEEQLGEAETARDGSYRIEYAEGRFLGRERGTADLVVKVLDAVGGLLVASPVRFNAPALVEIDLTIPRDRRAPPDLFTRIQSDILPLLGAVELGELEEDPDHQDLSFLAGETGFDRAVIARFVLAHRLVADDLPAELWFAVLGTSFFQYAPARSLADNLRAVSAALPTLDAASVRTALEVSLARGELREGLRAKIDLWIEAFLGLRVRVALGDEEAPTFLGQALREAGIDGPDRQETFARLYLQHGAPTLDFWAAVEKAGSFSEPERADLQTSYRLTDLTNGDFSVVGMLKRTFELRRPEQLPTLARQSEADWIQLIHREREARAINLPIAFDQSLPVRPDAAEAYGRALARQLREAFPTAAFAGELGRAMRGGQPRGLRHGQRLATFLDGHADFDLLHTRIDEYLERSVRAELRADVAEPGFRGELLAVQRIFKLAPTYEVTDALLSEGVHSAQMIYRMGESAFVQRYAERAGMSAEEARLTWGRAAETHAAALTIVMDLKSLDPETLPAAITSDIAALSSFPGYDELFKAGDVCYCQDCRSVLSPAAYFADILMFLRDRKSKIAGRSVKDILFSRRPDLGYLELNCENALTTLPYVDVVCEVLEREIAKGGSDVELVGLDAMPSDPAAAKAAVAAAHLGAGSDFTLSQIDPKDPDRWIVHGDAATYLLKKKPAIPATKSFFAELLPNTKASSEELRAYPAYVDAAAYAALRQAKFPSRLPFDLFGAEVRGAFEKLGLRRWELMHTLRGSAAPNDPVDRDIAAEYFGIGSEPKEKLDELRLIIDKGDTEAEQQAVWGEIGNAGWLVTLANVKTFLGKTGLEYEGLLALLELRFPNPASDISIEHLDASCDTDKKILKGLTVEKLDRIHRFLRMWRKLDGWKTWELDLVIGRPAIGDKKLDEAFLVSLSFFERLRARLGAKTTPSQVAALFDVMDVGTHFVKAFAPRQDGLYRSVFLNKRLVQPLDPALAVPEVNVPVPTLEKISGHRPAILGALGIREAELELLASLRRGWDGKPHITDDLTLSNLSFLWRHTQLARLLKLRLDDYAAFLKLLGKELLPLVDPARASCFVSPKAALAFVELADQLRASGFSPDELRWILAADRSAKSALKEADAAQLLTGLRAALQAIRKQYDQAEHQALNPPSDPDALATLLGSLLAQLHRDEASAQGFVATLRDEIALAAKAPGLPTGFDFPAAIRKAIPIRHDAAKATLRFTGLMTAAQQATLLNDTSLSAVTGLPAYRAAIGELFQHPRLLLKFLDPVFLAPLENLPAAVELGALADRTLAQRISYDPEQRALVLVGILSADDKATLDGLSADPPYRSAVASLYTQPLGGGFPADQLWLLDADLKFPLRDPDDPTNDHRKDNLATAIRKALVYLSRKLSEDAVVEQAAAQLGLTEGLTRQLLSSYAILPGPSTPLAYLAGPFAATSGAIDYATLPIAFDAWFWASRVASLARAWKLTLVEWQRLRAITASAKLLDLSKLPLNTAAPIASFELFQRTSRLIRVKDALPETGATLLQVLESLAGGGYATAADFAADVERLNEAWRKADVRAAVASLDLTYPGDYLFAESWERLRRAFHFTDSLGAGVDTVKVFAGAAMKPEHASTLKGLLRAKLGADTWLGLSAEIQDALRERKRDALSAFWLAAPPPPGVPTGKWDSPNDLYAYYLLDVEMSSCMSTSRLVQASGSVQLFVQRCLMGLEPEVVVDVDGDDGDSAWRWWTWMRKYRVWEANRKVFLWPENWIEPELRKDKSPFFKDLETELSQNELRQDTVEQAFTAYLEKLDGVAQLEPAGFFQEDDGDDTIVHVLGRTQGAEPRLYYYRRYDYRQWTPWEKVELDIQGEYLIPAVVNRRLYLFWPVFMEVPFEGSRTMTIPSPNQTVTLQPGRKVLRLQLAVSDYRQGKWTPKRVSKEYDESEPYDGEILHRHYYFYPIDNSSIDGRFAIGYEGFSVKGENLFAASLEGAFAISGCRGVPEQTDLSAYLQFALRPKPEAVGGDAAFLEWRELLVRLDKANDFLLESPQASILGTPRDALVLRQTPGLFRMSPGWHLSYLDRLLADGLVAHPGLPGLKDEVPLGTWLPFFYQDKKRTFFVLPATLELWEEVPRSYYPDVKRGARKLNDLLEGFVRPIADGFDLGSLSPGEREYMEKFLAEQFPGDELVPPFPDRRVRELLFRYFMRYVHYYIGLLSLYLFQFRQFDYRSFYHPFVCDFLKLVHDPLQGIAGLMRRETQLKDSGFSFERSYQPTYWVIDPLDPSRYPKETVDFSPDGAYAPYNWELFFHAPLLIAGALSKNQRFEEARDWYHYIFNPIGVESAVPGGSPMSKYWITRPFFETTDPQYVQQRIDNLLALLAGDATAPGYSAEAKKALEDQVRDWRRHPFEPHRIAGYRTVAYQKTVFMKYLDNLIAWGDFLFRQDSIESINEATQLYVLAAELLGPPPRKVPPRVKPPLESYHELERKLDVFGDALIKVENLVPLQAGGGASGADAAPLPTLYFCVPPNDKLLGYWDTIADRLYKIRHCMNLEGVVRQLALFEPPIDPAALVKAVAGGVDLGAALADLDAPLPLYRFNVLLAKANEMTGEVKALGVALLAALEKRDAEALALLRQDQELRLFQAVKRVRDSQIAEALENLESAKRAKELAQIRQRYYASREFMNTAETAAVSLSGISLGIDAVIATGYILATILQLIPGFAVGAAGFGGSPQASAETGGNTAGGSAATAAKIPETLTKALDRAAALSSTIASYQRRQDDWRLQEALATKELAQIERQIAAAELRVTIARQELANQELQIENAKAADDFMKSKYTNQELYQWQIGQISGVYFQSYKLANDLAKRAERCFRFELGVASSSFISFGYWDSLKKGLQAGEALQYDLRRMEVAYLEQNRRELELTKHVSLRLLDPLALVRLRETGQCFFQLPEEIFDLDYPGHYFRRIKSVSLTLPCVAGPYTTISATLRLLGNSVRVSTKGGDSGYPRNTDEQGHPADDPRFVESNAPVKAIAASGGQNDSGLFELDFRDERYLPFEGAGAISGWSLELFHDLPANNPDPGEPDFGRPLRQFDYESITDAVLHVKYTAREDAGPFRNGAIKHLRGYFQPQDPAAPSWLVLDLRRDFPTQWSRGLHPTKPADGNVLELDMSADLFPLRDSGKAIQINTIWLLARCRGSEAYGVTLTPPLPAPPPVGQNAMSLVRLDRYGGLHVAERDVSAFGVTVAPTAPSVTWKLRVTRPGGGNLNDPEELGELLLVLGYQWA